MTEFSPLTQEALKYYVYLLRMPMYPNSVFYVGKGTGNRVFAHVAEAILSPRETDKLQVIRYIHEQKEEVIHQIVRHGMTEEEAFEVEAALIEVFKLSELKNEVLGHGKDRGMKSDRELELQYAAKPVTVIDPVFLGFCTKFVPDVTSPEDLYQDTRYCWKVIPSKHPAKYAFAIYNKVIREVYEIENWELVPQHNRYLFNGHIAPDNIRNRYLFKDISAYIVKDAISKKTGKPIKTINQNLKWINC